MTSSTSAPTDSAGSFAAAILHRENYEWCDIWMPNADKEDLPRVLLIGDSICRGYAGEVERLLDGKAYVARQATSRGIGDPVLFDELRLLIRHHRFAVIHFNHGLHGIDYTDAEYEAGMKAFVQVLRAFGQGATLVWATTTAVLPGFTHWKSDEWNRDLVESRNAIARRLAQADNIPINDLCAVTRGKPEFYNDDKVHYNAKGDAVLAAQVAESVEQVLRMSNSAVS